MRVRAVGLIFLLSIGLALFSCLSAQQPDNQKKIQVLQRELAKAQEDAARISILRRIAQNYMQNEPLKALEYAKQAVALCRKLGAASELANSLDVLSQVHYLLGDFQKTLANLTEIVQIREKLGNKKGLAQSYNMFGVIYYTTGEFDRALSHIKKSLHLWEELKDDTGIAMTINNIGNVFYLKGDFSKALRYYLESMKIKEKLGDKKGLSDSYNNIGLVYDQIGSQNESLAYFFKSLRIRQELGKKRLIGDSYLNIGLNYQSQKKYQQALDYYYKAKKIAEEFNYTSLLGSICNAVGDVYFSAKEYDRALEFFQKGRLIHEASGEKQSISESCAGIGKSYRLKGQNRKALPWLLRAVQIGQDIHSDISLSRSMDELSKVYAALGQFKNAHHYHVLYKEIYDRLQGNENAKSIIRIGMQYEFEQKQEQQKQEQSKKDIFEETQLKQQRWLKTFFSGFAFLVAIVFFIRFRLKVKVNRQLRQEIHEREKAEAELLKSMKLETVGLLSDGIAHDFNNLLAIIAGNLELANMSIPDESGKINNYLGNSRKATEQAVDLMQKFLTLSTTGEWVVKDKVNLQEIVNNACLSVPQLAEITFTKEIPVDIFPLYGEERQLRQVLVNLLVNAYEATTDNLGEKMIQITAYNKTITADNVWYLKPGDYVCVSVVDNGRGIPEAVMSRIFDPYFSTKERGTQKGMGMGLAICLAIVKKHYGHIRVTSSMNQRTGFEMILPAYAPPL